MDVENFILQCKNISKNFGVVNVLEGINLDIRKGEVHAILGINGAGKSTLMKIISGAHLPSGGELIYKGERLNLKNPIDAHKKGISIIYQELSLIPTLKSYENLFIGNEILDKFGFVDTKKMRNEFIGLCGKLNFNIDPDVQVKKLSISQQQMIEIMKAVFNNSEIIIMDEPTTSLSENEKISLFRVIEKLKKEGKTILYISHLLDEVLAISDRISVLRDGKFIGTHEKIDLTKEKVISLMTGKEFKKRGLLQKNSYSDAEKVLEVKNISVEGKINNVSLYLKKGEILGIAGLVGSGRTELIEGIYGFRNSNVDEICIKGKRCSISSPIDAIKYGIGLIPEDRKNYGLILKHSIKHNASIVQLKNMVKGLFLAENKQRQHIEKAKKNMSIKMDTFETKVSNLSGGNQQKVVISKWMDMNLNVLIFDEPTKGIDINAKEDIFKVIEEYSDKGTGVIFISSDLEEVERVSDRVLIMKKGEIIKELTGKEITIENINYYSING